MPERSFLDDINLTDSGFDNLEGFSSHDERMKYAEDLKERGRYLDHLIHRVFEQNEQGKELITRWKESLIMNPTVHGGIDAFQAGINEGLKTFIRGILLTVDRVERGES